MRLIDLHWDDRVGEGYAQYARDFLEAHQIVQLDMLADCIDTLQNKYYDLLATPDAADPKAFYGFPNGSVSSPNAGGNGVTAGETAP